jgi:branched-chain amino acid transport system substrate-binding protein
MNFHPRTSIAVAALLATVSSVAFAQVTEVRIGLMTDTQYTYARIGGATEIALSARLAIQDYHAAGGKLNVLTFSADEGAVPFVTRATAEGLIKKDHVTMITGLVSSGGAGPAFQVGKENKVITVVSSGSSTALINTQCSPYSVQWFQNTYNLAKGVLPTLVKQGKKKWFIVYADYTFGIALTADAKTIIEQNGGTVVGTAKHNFPATDFTEVIKAAKEAEADAIGVASAGSDMVGFLNAAAANNVATDKKTLVPLSLYLQDINDLGLEKAGGMTTYSSVFWNQYPSTLHFSKPFYEQIHRMPDMGHMATYSSITQYLKAVDATGTTDSAVIMDYWRSHPIDDAIIHNGKVRLDGSMIHDGAVVHINTLNEAKNEWDYYKVIQPLSGEDVAYPIEQSTCPNVTQARAAAAAPGHAAVKPAPAALASPASVAPGVAAPAKQAALAVK